VAGIKNRLDNAGAKQFTTTGLMADLWPAADGRLLSAKLDKLAKGALSQYASRDPVPKSHMGRMIHPKIWHAPIADRQPQAVPAPPSLAERVQALETALAKLTLLVEQVAAK
jgi:hypothetical protein